MRIPHFLKLVAPLELSQFTVLKYIIYRLNVLLFRVLNLDMYVFVLIIKMNVYYLIIVIHLNQMI